MVKWAVYVCGLCVLGLKSREMMSAPAPSFRTAHRNRRRQMAERWNGRPGQKRTGSGLVWTALHHNNKHGPPGSCKLLLPFQVSPGALEVTGSFAGLSATVELPKRFRYFQVALN